MNWAKKRIRGNEKFLVPLNVFDDKRIQKSSMWPMFATDVPVSTVTYWDVTTFQEVDEIRGGCLYAEA